MSNLLSFSLLTLLTLLALVLNGRLHSPASAVYDRQQIVREVMPQLRFLRQQLDKGAGEKMQRLFPEGYFFMHALYGLTWVDVGLRESDISPRRAEALREARWALANLDSEAGRAVFSPELDPPYGVFYVGWRTWLQGGVLKLQDPAARGAADVARFEADCAALASAFERSSTPFLPAYPAAAWPVDNTVAMAALRLHDALLPPRYAGTINRWRAAVQTRLDPATGLMPHAVQAGSGELLDGSRATSQSLITRFLYEVDPEWGREQYERYRTQFVTTPLGVPGVREYPRGVKGSLGDVDSGPLIMGLSASASTVTIGTAQVLGDRELALALMNSAEAAGLPMQWRGKKRYGFGLLPVGDAFIAWSKVSQPWVSEERAALFKPVIPSWWRWAIHLGTGVPLLLWWRVALKSHRKAMEQLEATPKAEPMPLWDAGGG